MIWRWGKIATEICTSMMIATQVSKDHYLYPILDKDASFYHSHNENSNHYQHYHSQPSSSSPPHHLQNQESNTAAVERTWKDPFIKRILVVDDDPDITLTFKVGLEEYHYYHDDKRRFEVYTYNNHIPWSVIGWYKYAKDEWLWIMYHGIKDRC